MALLGSEVTGQAMALTLQRVVKLVGGSAVRSQPAYRMLGVPVTAVRSTTKAPSRGFVLSRSAGTANRAEVTNKERKSEPPKQHEVGLLTGNPISQSTLPSGAKRTSLPAANLAFQR